MSLTDRYELLELLGSGSFGKVFRAFDKVMCRTVAIKILHQLDDDARRRFHREAVILHGQAGNEFVVELLDYTGLADTIPYIALEFCEFKSLRHWVGVGRRWEDISLALSHAAKGLAGLHAAGGLHRDIKPENMLLSRAATLPGWKVKLADFGLGGFPNPVTGTMTRSAAGTKGYIAPELVGSAEFQPAADIYSLGVVGVELLVGRFDVRALAACGVPSALKSLLQAMVYGLPEARPTAQAVGKTLSALLVAAPSVAWTAEPQRLLHTAPPGMQAAPSTAGSGLAKGAVVVGALAIGALWLANNSGSRGQDRGPDGRFR